MEEKEPQYPDSPNDLLDNLIDVKRALADVLTSLKAYNNMNGTLLASARKAARYVGLQDLFAESAYEFKPKGNKPWKPYEGEFVRVTSKDLIEDCESRGVFPGAVGVVHSRGSQWGWWVDHGPARCCYHAHELYPVIHGTGCTCPACVAQTAAAREEAAVEDAPEGVGPEPGILAPSASDPPAAHQGAVRIIVDGHPLSVKFPSLGADLIENLGRHVRWEWMVWARQQANPKPSWLVPWTHLSGPDRDVDMRIGTALYERGFSAGAEFVARIIQAQQSSKGGDEIAPMTEVESYGWAHQCVRPMYKANVEVYLIERVLDLVSSAVREAWARRRVMITHAVQIEPKDG